MFKLFDSGLCPIGIDVGTHAVRLVQFRSASAGGGGGGLKLQAACRIELDSLDNTAMGAARAAAAVQHALSSQDFKGREAVLSLPVACVHSKSVRLPQMPDSDLSQALQWEAKDRFGFEVGQSTTSGGTVGQLVWFRAGEVRRGTEIKDEILLFAVEGGVLNEYIEALANVGLRLKAVDLAPCATYRSLRRAGGAAMTSQTGSPTGNVAAILDLGHAGAQFYILRGEELVFYKHVEVGGRAINEAVASKLGISTLEALQMRARLMTETGAGDAAPLGQALLDATRAPLEELSRELDMCMRYFVVTFRGSRPETLALTGRQSASVNVRDLLASALGLQVEEAQPLRGVQELGDAARPDRSGEWAIAAGLSLYPVKAHARLEVAA